MFSRGQGQIDSHPDRTAGGPQQGEQRPAHVVRRDVPTGGVPSLVMVTSLLPLHPSEYMLIIELHAHQSITLFDAFLAPSGWKISPWKISPGGAQGELVVGYAQPLDTLVVIKPRRRRRLCMSRARSEGRGG